MTGEQAWALLRPGIVQNENVLRASRYHDFDTDTYHVLARLTDELTSVELSDDFLIHVIENDDYVALNNMLTPQVAT